MRPPSPFEEVPRALFDEDVYDHFYSASLEESSSVEALLIAGLAGLGEGADVLDVPCGDGRIAAQLGRLGCCVVGVDRSARFIAAARKRAVSDGVRFEVGDMRELRFKSEFDCVVNWFTSFGYFDAPTNRAMLHAFRRALRRGGWLVLEQRNPTRLQRAIEAGGGTASYVVDRGLDLLVDRACIDRDRLRVERFVVRDGRVRKVEFSIELLAGRQLTTILEEAGFTKIRLLDERGRSVDAQSSRLVALAQAK